MRACMLVLCCGVLVAGCAGTKPFAEAPEGDWTRKPVAVPFMRIGRGLMNIVTSPADITGTMSRLWGEADTVGGYAGASTLGLLEGVGNGVVRIGAGVVEIVTFPLIYKPDPFYNREYGGSVFYDSTSEP